MLNGTSTLLVGGPGAGKTYSLATLAASGLELFCVFTEPGGEEALLQAVERYKVPIDRIHWNYIAPASPSWEIMLSSARTVSQLSFAALTDIKAGINKQAYHQFVDLLQLLSNFKCLRTGESYGPVDSWGPERAIVLDGLSGLNIIAMDMVVGSKPVKHQGEWGVAMDAEERLVMKLCADTKAFFVLVAHIEREINELTGAQQIMAGALGRKLAPKLPRFFSDVVHAYREGDQFYWSTVSVGVDLKARTLPLKDKLPPDFGQIVTAWRKRNETAAASSTLSPNAGEAAAAPTVAGKADEQPPFGTPSAAKPAAAGD